MSGLSSIGRIGAAATLALLLVAAFAAASQAGVMYGAMGRGSATNPGAVITIDQTNGSGTLVGDPITPGGLTGIDFDGLGRLWGSSIDGLAGSRTSQIVEINPDTGSLISSVAITRSSDGAAISIGDLAIQPGTGVVYGIRSNSDALATPAGQLFTIDTATGVATLVGDTAQNRSGGLAFAPDGTLFFLEFDQLHALSLIDASVLTTVNLNFAEHDGLGIRSDGTLFATRARGIDEVRIIDPMAGTSTLLGSTGMGAASDLAFRPMAVPEPATLLLFGIGLAGIGRARRPKRSR